MSGIEGVEAEKLGARAANPVAVKPTVCGLPESLSVKTRLAVLGPEADGEKVKVTVQSLIGATV